MKRVLLTGGSGFVGANLARRLLSDGHEVHLLLRPGHQTWRIEPIRDHVRLHVGALADRSFLKGVLDEAKPDWVFHLAAYGAYSWQTELRTMVETNVLGLGTLIDACIEQGFEAFVNTGSSSEYGWTDHAPAEDEPLDPNSHYALTKAAATHLCRLTSRQRDLKMPTLRLYSVYGPLEEPKRFIPTLIREGLKGKLPPLVNPNVARDYVYVDDVCEAYVLAASKPLADKGAIYNVGTGVQTTIREAVTCIGRILPLKEKPAWGTMKDRKWDTDVWVSDPRKIKKELGWSPEFSLEQGLRRTIETGA